MHHHIPTLWKLCNHKLQQSISCWSKFHFSIPRWSKFHTQYPTDQNSAGRNIPKEFSEFINSGNQHPYDQNCTFQYPADKNHAKQNPTLIIPLIKNPHSRINYKISELSQKFIYYVSNGKKALLKQNFKLGNCLSKSCHRLLQFQKQNKNLIFPGPSRSPSLLQKTKHIIKYK